METAVFKQLASGEPVSARHIFGRPFTMTDYAKMVFLCNELPWQIEQTDAFFRRFIIIPFDQTIPEEERDPDLANKIIASERSGVFNWMLDGLKRLLKNKRFTDSEVIKRQIELFRYERDTVAVFLGEKNYVPSEFKSVKLAELYADYTDYCKENMLRTVSNITFAKRLRYMGFHIFRKSACNYVHYGLGLPRETQQEIQPVNAEASAPVPAKRPVRTIPNKKVNDTSNEKHSK